MEKVLDLIFHYIWTGDADLILPPVGNQDFQRSINLFIEIKK